MLNELDMLSQNIGRLISIGSRYQHSLRALEQQLEQQRAALGDAHQALEHTRNEHDALRRERDLLALKIDDARAQLGAIMAKLPPPSSNLSTLLIEPFGEEGEKEEA